MHHIHMGPHKLMHLLPKLGPHHSFWYIQQVCMWVLLTITTTYTTWAPLVTSQNMSNASQILEQQCIWHTYLRYQTRSKTNSSHFTINGVHKERKSSPTVTRNSCTWYGSSCSMTSSSMPPPMAWLCTAWMELSNRCIHASWPIRQITPRSMYFLLFLYIVTHCPL